MVKLNKLIFFQLSRSYQPSATKDIFETVELGPDLDQFSQAF